MHDARRRNACDASAAAEVVSDLPDRLGSGAELAQRAYQQAWLFGAKYVFAREVEGLRTDGEERVVTLSDERGSRRARF